MNHINKPAKKPKPEYRFYKDTRKAHVFLECGLLVKGTINWVDDYSMGFTLEELLLRTDGSKVSTDHLGLVKGKESLIMKGLVRVVTPA